MSSTSIQWTDHSINPIRARLGDAIGHHCEKISPGCANCYASTLQKRFNMPAFKGAGAGLDGKECFLDESKLHEVLRRKKPTKYFWCDMTDMFGDWVPDEWIDKCIMTMILTPQHIHQVLTKRPERMRGYFTSAENVGRLCHALASIAGELDEGFGFELRVGNRKDNLNGFMLPNLWLGVSVEDQRRADERIPHLLQTPAAVRFLSCQPLLGPVNLRTGIYAMPPNGEYRGTSLEKGAMGHIAWVIIGGESGPNARPFNILWARNIRAQCLAANVPCFIKQFGSHVIGPYCERLSMIGESCDPNNNDDVRWKLRDRKGGDPSEWPEDLRVRLMPTVEGHR